MKLRLRLARRDAKNAVASFEVLNAATDRGNLSGKFKPGNSRIIAFRRRIKPSPLQQIRTVQARGTYFYQNLRAFRRGRVFHLSNFKVFNPAKFVDVNG